MRAEMDEHRTLVRDHECASFITDEGPASCAHARARAREAVLVKARSLSERPATRVNFRVCQPRRAVSIACAAAATTLRAFADSPNGNGSISCATKQRDREEMDAAWRASFVMIERRQFLDDTSLSLCSSAPAEGGDQQSPEQEGDRGEGRRVAASGMRGQVGQASRLDRLVSRQRADQGRRHHYQRNLHPGR